MALKVVAEHPNYPKGTEISFGDFFLAKVGEEVTVSDEDVARFKATTGKDLKDSLPTLWIISTAAAEKPVEVAGKTETTVSDSETMEEDKGGENA